MASTVRHVKSNLLTFFRSHSPEEQQDDSRPLSDAVILAIAFVIGFFICFVSALANAFLIRTALPAAGLWIKINAAGGVVAILLTWKLLRWSRDRNRLIRQRERASEALNQEIRNAIHVIYLETYSTGKEVPDVIKQNVARIDHVLNEFAPMPFRRCARERAQDRIRRDKILRSRVTRRDG